MRLNIFRTHQSATSHVHLDTRKCHACWKCIDACHRQVLGKIDLPIHKHAVIQNPDACTGCKKCITACTYGAFTERRSVPVQEGREPKINTGKEGQQMKEGKKPFNRRAFLSVLLAASGLLLPYSGFMNHTLQMAPLTVGRHFWMSVHNVSALLFTCAAISHVVIHRHALMHYAKGAQRVLITKEAAAALGVLFFVVGFFSMHALHVK
jgi:ferredoxin